MSSLKNSIFWSLFGQLGYSVIALIANILFVRVLSPKDFGVIGIAMFFIGVSNVLVESGIGGALIRKNNVSEKDYSTVFLLNLGISIFLMLALLLSANFIASFYNLPELKHILWILSSLLIINSLTIINRVKLVKEMKFKELGVFKFVSFFIASTIALYLAYYKSFGIWSVLIMQVLSAALFMVILWFKQGRLKKVVFSKKSFKEVFSFGAFTTLSSILDAAFNNIYELILGKYFNVTSVGFYYQAKTLYQAPDVISKNIILQVFYSHLSAIQDDRERFNLSFINVSKNTALIIGFVFSLIYIYSEHIIIILYGEEWIKTGFFLKMILIYGFFSLQEMVNRNIFKIYNQTHKIFYLELFKKSVQLITIFIGIYYLNIEVLLYGFILTSIVSYFTNSYFSLKMISLDMKLFFCNILKIVFSITISVFIFCTCLNMIFDKVKYVAFLLAPLFIIVYIIPIKLFKITDSITLFSLKRMLKIK
ncbi:lipopolysaccharide biosynthesis protein [Tenacibaculum aestuariivivum]|uniref:lipopolysaccharide biosynthesis protein n=1 Tax=Tenacibaculum aestuariivivum TaxID=2006131 RepID=UPI003AB8AE6E